MKRAARQTSQSGCQELDVRGLVARNLLQVGIEGGIITGSGELGSREVGEALTIEFVFEMLQRQGIVEDIG